MGMLFLKVGYAGGTGWQSLAIGWPPEGYAVCLSIPRVRLVSWYEGYTGYAGYGFGYEKFH